MTYKLTTLKSGLRVASETLPGFDSVAFVVSVGVGARYENESENGISHLLEHMAFKGTKTRSARDIAEAFDAVGGQINAYTSMEATVYHAKVLKGDIELAAHILGDIMLNSVFDPTELAREQGVIIQEIAMHRDTPDDLINDYFDETAYPAQPLGRTILSNEKQIASYTRDDVIRYMEKHYRPPRIVISAAGNIEHDVLLMLVEKYFPFPASLVGPTPEPGRYAGGDARVKGDFEQLHMMLGLPAVSQHSPDYYALQLFSGILGGGMSSRLFQEVREKRGLAYTVYAMMSTYSDCGMLLVYAATAPEKARELCGVLCEEIIAMGKTVNEAELNRAKNQIKAELLMARENPQNIATWMGRHLLVYNEYRQIADILKRIDTVTIADMERLSKMMLKGKPTLAALGEVSGVMPYDQLAAKLAA